MDAGHLRLRAPVRGHDDEATLVNVVARARVRPEPGSHRRRVSVAGRQGPRRRAARQGPRASPRPSSCTRFLAASTGRCSGALSPPTCRRRSACVTVRLAAAAVGAAMPVPTTMKTRRTCRTAVVPVIHCNCPCNSLILQVLDYFGPVCSQTQAEPTELVGSASHLSARGPNRSFK